MSIDYWEHDVVRPFKSGIGSLEFDEVEALYIAFRKRFEAEQRMAYRHFGKCLSLLGPIPSIDELEEHL